MDFFFSSGEVTAFAFAVRNGEFYEGRVNLLTGPRALCVQHACLGVRDTEETALEDAHTDAVRLVRRWQDQTRFNRPDQGDAGEP